VNLRYTGPRHGMSNAQVDDITRQVEESGGTGLVLPPPKTLLGALKYAGLFLERHVDKGPTGYAIDPMWDADVDGPFVDGIRADLYSSSSTDLHRQMYGWSAGWCISGFPVVEPSHRLIASMMCTSADAERVAWPWTEFAVRLPVGMVAAQVAGKSAPITSLLVSQFSGGVCILGVSDAGAAWTCGVRPFSQLGDGDVEGVAMASGPGVEMLDALDERIAKVVDRLVLGVCNELSSPEWERERTLRKVRHAHATSSAAKCVTQDQTYRLGRPVQVDCRKAVAAYLAGERRSAMTVRWLTRGHWKQQPYGPQSNLRRWQQIEPYWSSKKKLTTLVRPHKVGS
jgi:hypothetical protein